MVMTPRVPPLVVYSPSPALPMPGVDLEKVAARRLGCAAGAWRRPFLFFALVTSAAALFASLSSPSRVSLWSLSSHSDVTDVHSPDEDISLLLPTSAPSASPVGDYAPLETADQAERDAMMPPFGNFSRAPERADVFSPITAPLTASSALPPLVTLNMESFQGQNFNSGFRFRQSSVNSHVPSPSRIISDVGELEQISLRETDLQLRRAKEEIAAAPNFHNDSELYAPLFLNISVFKRSYELMERTLKVYIYEEGPPPLCHMPELGGIYASEGWFMKQMEENKQFVVKDPSKAHLFYLPYSSLQLRTHLYVPGSRSMEPLSIFLRDYVNSIAAKYPFWNRTQGADHFLVACHDWATYTTKLHPQLRRNAIKAVCNADASEGFFSRGKDVSLPETYVRTAAHKAQDSLGGKPPSKRTILAFFAGQMHGRVRPVLLRHWKGTDRDMRIYEVLPSEVARKMSYVDHMKSARYCICPMGYEVNSPRIVEAIHYECVPVIIADNFVLPFEEVLDWAAFSVVVAEKDIPNLKRILVRISWRRYRVLQANVKMLKKHFVWNEEPRKYDIFHMILHSIWFNRLNQIQDR